MGHFTKVDFTIKKHFEIIIPIFNEGAEFVNLLDRLFNEIDYNFNVLIAYDYDQDPTLDFIKKNKHFNNIKLVKNFKSGPNAAILTAINFVEADHFLVYMADDFSNIKLINDIYKKSINSNHKYDLIVPSRFIDGGKMLNCPFPKNFLVRIGNYVFKFLVNDITDATNAFKFFKSSTFKKLKIISNEGFTYAIEATIKIKILGHESCEIPSIWVERKNGKSNFKIIKWLPYYIYWLIYLFIMKFKK